MTPDQRIAAIKKMLDAADAEKSLRGEACIGCIYARGAEYEYSSKCVSPVAFVAAQKSARTGTVTFPRLVEMRSSQGLCGPEGLLFQAPLFVRPFWRQPTMDRQFFWSFAQIPCAVIALVLLLIAVGKFL